MRKLFLMLVFVAIALGAKAQENAFSIKGGAGFAMLQDDTDADVKLKTMIIIITTRHSICFMPKCQ